MRRLYWRARGISRAALVVVAVISVVGLASVERFKTTRRRPYYTQKMQAAKIAEAAMGIIRDERLELKLPSNEKYDPAGSGLIGDLMSPTTSAVASLSAKQTSVNPNFAAVVVELLLEAGVREGDVVAVGCTGSFPAMNIAVYAAMRALELKPVIITSVASSQYGANEPKLLWVDMERALNKADSRSFPYRSVAASRGGVDDRGEDLSDLGREMIDGAIKRNELPLLLPRNLSDSISRHMSVYVSEAADNPIKTYINIGGGTASTGTRLGKRMFQPGLNLRKARGVEYTDSVMTKFIEQGIPVLHFAEIHALADRYGLPTAPVVTPPPGKGGIFEREEYSRTLALAVLVVIIASTYAFIRSQIGYRILQTRARSTSDVLHEPMV